ncbi:MAG: response regulator, partial [candidate division Zixibacteria bacterium]|nr:response regulator [candidate division Zixibacteria bacterium]
MRKKILIAEKSDAIRNIAESLLHQHGYDVISSATADKAKELIITSEPNMIIIDSGLKDQNGSYLYDLLEESEQTASIPFLIITDANGQELSYPPEVILNRPFETDDLLEKVKLFIGTGTDEKPIETIAEVDPFSTGDVDDDFLDAAFGIDSIDVESSEVMDKTTITERARMEKRKSDTTDIGIGHKEESNAKDDDSGKVESLLIREDGSEEKTPKKEELPDLSASSKIEIPTNQFEVDNNAKPANQEKADDKKTGDHDYDWFINEMKKDTSDIKFEKPGNETGSQKIQLTNTSDGMNPIMPSKEKKDTDKPEIKSGGVDQFISEFKQEMEQL